jgi:hypothetical protein
MNYEFELRKLPRERAQADLSVKPTAEQVPLVHWVTAQLRQLLIEYLGVADHTAILASEAPFHLFELSDKLCRILGFEGGCVVLLEVLDAPPKVFWSNEDLSVLERVPVDRLRAMCCALAYFVTKKHSFTRLTA